MDRLMRFGCCDPISTAARNGLIEIVHLALFAPPWGLDEHGLSLEVQLRGKNSS